MIWLLACSGGEPAIDAVFERPYAGRPSAAGARVVTDVSASMQGFIRPDDVTMTRLHEEIAGAVGAHSTGALSWCGVDTEIRCEGTLPNLSRYSSRKFYASQVGQYHLALDPGASEGLTIVVTDGGVGGGGGGATDTEGCSAGSTVACVSGRLRDLIDQGFGVWAVGVALPFDGTVYAERALDKGMFERIAAGATAGKVSDLQPSAGRATYHYEGPRPILILVTTRDIAGGRAIAAELQQRLLKQSIADPLGAGVEMAEWAPLPVPRIAFAGVSAEPGTDMRTAGFLLGPGLVNDDRYEQQIACGVSDKGYVRARLTAMQPGLVIEKHPNARGIEQLDPVEDGFRLGVVCGNLPSGTSRLGLRVRLEDPVGKLHSKWIDAWSADDSFSRPDGLFGLSLLARAAEDEAARSVPPVAEVVLRVDRQ
jgi:hypothetical protein